MAEFKNPTELTTEEIIGMLVSGTDDEICDALASLAFYDEDWKWPQDQCLFFLQHSNLQVRSFAALCLGHIARRHRHLDPEVKTILQKHLNENQDLSGHFQDALDDIHTFLSHLQN